MKKDFFSKSNEYVLMEGWGRKKKGALFKISRVIFQDNNYE